MLNSEIGLDGNEITLQDPYNRQFFYQKSSNSFNSYNYLKTKFKNTKQNLKQKSFYKNILFTRLPILKWLFFQYNFKQNIFHDIIAGFTVGIMSIPQTMGISLLANLPPVNGLYMSFFPIFIYLIFGTSRHLVVGRSLILMEYITEV
jgi:hypothetical protein